MDFDKITELLDNIDPEKWMPNLENLVGDMEIFVNILVLVAPLLLVLLGFIYFFLPPAEANHSIGYQFFWGKSSVDAWRFMQKIAGGVFCVLGLVLTIVMLILNKNLTDMEAVDMVFQAGQYLIWELVAVLVACLLIDLVMLVIFNFKGKRRQYYWVKKLFQKEK